jgi:phosphonate transport system ATP-binding protein
LSANLVVRELSKRYGSTLALDDVSFSAAAGELVAILGPSGAGKTTLFRCITGLQRPDTGSVAFDGRPIRELKRAEIGMIFQQFNLIARSSAIDNVLVGRIGTTSTWRVLTRNFARADRERALAALQRVGLRDVAEQRADRLSGGQQQRVAIARALAQNSRYVLADEPVASLDPVSSQTVLAALKAIARDDGLAVLCTLHQVELAAGFADRIIGMLDGRIVADVRAAQFGTAEFSTIYRG